MTAPRPWRIERNEVGNSEIIDAAGNRVTRVICAFDKEGAPPQAHTAIFDDDAALIVAAVNGQSAPDSEK